MIKIPSIGADPEFLLRDKKTGILIPAFNYIHGSKLSPQDLKKPGYQVLYDNVLAEGNIPPASSREEFINNMISLKTQINELVSNENLEVVAASVGDYLREHLKDKKANEFGCAPFMDAWENLEVTAPIITDVYRTVGFHVHVGYDNPDNLPTEIINLVLARTFDLFAVLPAIMHNHDPRRDKSYGGFGKYRDKSYGLEFRSLGGYFAKDELLGWVYDRTLETVQFVFNNLDKVDKILNLTIEDITPQTFEILTERPFSEVKININEKILVT